MTIDETAPARLNQAGTRQLVATVIVATAAASTIAPWPAANKQPARRATSGLLSRFLRAIASMTVR